MAVAIIELSVMPGNDIHNSPLMHVYMGCVQRYDDVCCLCVIAYAYYAPVMCSCVVSEAALVLTDKQLLCNFRPLMMVLMDMRKNPEHVMRYHYHLS